MELQIRRLQFTLGGFATILNLPNKFHEVFVHHIGHFHGGKVSSLLVVGAVDQIEEFILERPVDAVRQVVLESSTARRDTRRYSVHIHAQLPEGKGFGVQSLGCCDGVCEVVHHDVVQKGVHCEAFGESSIG